MANWTLSAPDLRMLVDIMTRSELFDTPTQRKNFFTYSGYADALSNLQSDIPLSDGTADFCKTLVRHLKEGLLPDGSHHALYLLLDYLLTSINGHSIEKSLVEKWLEESEVSVRQSLPSPSTKATTVNLETIYDEALSAFFDEQWEEVLRLVIQLEDGNYNDSHRMTKVADMKQDATEECVKAKRKREYEADYRHVAMLTRKPERLQRAQQAWATFLQKHREDFLPDRDPEGLGLFFEQQRLLAVMYNMEVTPIERAQAGRDLAKIGDPRPEVMDVDSMHFCWVPEGRFWMGSASIEEDPFSYDHERPADWFTIPYGYWIGRFPVTNSQYEQFVKATEAENRSENYGDPFTLSNHPVVGVTWHQALAFTQWLTARWRKAAYLPIDWQVMLPNEPEWEKAARGGETFSTSAYGVPAQLRTIPPTTPRANLLPRRRYPYGNEAQPNHSNYSASRIVSTNAVGAFWGGTSPYGCEEMSGNVWEWNRSIGDQTYPYTTDRNTINLHNIRRVYRGGAFNLDERDIRCTCRRALNQLFEARSYGFRVVVVAVPHPS